MDLLSRGTTGRESDANKIISLLFAICHPLRHGMTKTVDIVRGKLPNLLCVIYYFQVKKVIVLAEEIRQFTSYNIRSLLHTDKKNVLILQIVLTKLRGTQARCTCKNVSRNHTLDSEIKSIRMTNVVSDNSFIATAFFS